MNVAGEAGSIQLHSECGQRPAKIHIVDVCSLTKFESSLPLLHEAADNTVSWLETTVTDYSTREMNVINFVMHVALCTVNSTLGRLSEYVKWHHSKHCLIDLFINWFIYLLCPAAEHACRPETSIYSNAGCRWHCWTFTRDQCWWRQWRKMLVITLLWFVLVTISVP